MFNHDTLSTYFNGILMMNINKFIASYLVHKKIGILEINAYVEDISNHIRESVEPEFEEYGIRLLNFNVLSINVPDDDPATQRLKEALSKRAEMNILGYTYQQERTFDTLEGAAKNPGGSPIMDAGIGMAMGMGVGQPIGAMMAQMNQHLMPNAPQQPCPACQTLNKTDAHFCSGCGQSLSTAPTEVNKIPCDNCGMPLVPGSKFCPHCGDAYNPCPSCSSDNPKDARNCVQCGTSLGVSCPQCSTLVASGSKFCPECGTTLTMQCRQCQTEVQPGQKFCLECGHKLI